MSRTIRKPYTKSKRWDRTCRNHGSCSYCSNGRQHKHKRAMPAPNGRVKEDFHHYETTYGPLSYNDHLTPESDIKEFTTTMQPVMGVDFPATINAYLAGLKLACCEEAARRHDDAYHATLKKPSLLQRIINHIKSVWKT